ncbi:MAG: hypothetical protein IJC28_02250 [Mailhella sp.]|nr:hypothetical protein [Mailhella sp.]MBQ4325722.1 hypothetical protein [Mailhella sp.]
MAITIQNLQDLSNVTSLSQVHIVEGHAEVRGGLKAAFQKIADFFKGWTASGRAELASRNENLLLAMRRAVDAARESRHEQARALTGRLNTALNRLTEAAAPNVQKVKDDTLSALRSESKFKALPEAAKRDLAHAAGTILDKLPRSNWQDAINAMKIRFYGPHDTGKIMVHLRDQHVGQFSKPSEWEEIHGVKNPMIVTSWPTVDTVIAQLLTDPDTANVEQLETAFNRIVKASFHNTLQSGVGENAGEGLLDKLRNAANEIRDAVNESIRRGVMSTDAKASDEEEARTIVNAMLDKHLGDDAIQKAIADADLKRGISQVYIKDTKRGCVASINGEAMGKGKSVEIYINTLRAAVGAENARYLPFITTMLSQSGIEASAIDLQKGCGFSEEDITDNGLLSDNNKNRVNTVERDGNDLVIHHSSRAKYIAPNSELTPIFYADVTLTMRIHLDQPPSGTVEHPNGTAYIPSFSYEGLSLTYSAPQPGEV